MIKNGFKGKKIESWPHPNDYTACAIFVQSFKAYFFFAAWPSFLRWEKVLKTNLQERPFLPRFLREKNQETIASTKKQQHHLKKEIISKLLEHILSLLLIITKNKAPPPREKACTSQVAPSPPPFPPAICHIFLAVDTYKFTLLVSGKHFETFGYYIISYK